MSQKKKAKNKLEDLEVERVDAVDDPATGRGWLIMKSTETNDAGNEFVGKATSEEDSVVTGLNQLLEEITKDTDSDELNMSEDAVNIINSLIKILGYEASFKSVQKTEEQETEASTEESTTEAEQNEEQEEEENEDNAVIQALSRLETKLGELEAKVEKVASAKPRFKTTSAKTASAQTEENQNVQKTAAKKLGEGLFTNVVFGGR